MRRWSSGWFFGGLGLTLVALGWLQLSTGAVSVEPLEVLHWGWRQLAWWSTTEISHERQLWLDGIIGNLRWPRFLAGVLAGASLALAGVGTQTLFRNPLADPGLIGVTAGAAVGAVSLIALGPSFSQLPGAQPLAALIGGFLTVYLVYRLARMEGRTSILQLLLAGMAVNALAVSIVGFILLRAEYGQMRDFHFWMLGSLSAVGNRENLALAVCLLLAAGCFGWLARPMNALLLGEAEAGHLGVPVERLKTAIVLLASALVGTVVAAAGAIGFVGLLAPHWVRLFLGPDHRQLLPGAILLGAVLVSGSDWVARMLFSPLEIPIGIITALIGAPAFLFFLRHRSGGQWS